MSMNRICKCGKEEDIRFNFADIEDEMQFHAREFKCVNCMKDAKSRKETPIFSGVLHYFPDAIAEVARTSFIGNEQHNPGTKLHWDRSKSGDELDALARHLMDAGTMDDDGIRHSAKVAWRALANLQKEIEDERMQDWQEDIIRDLRELDLMYPDLDIDGVHPREAKEEEKRKFRLSEDRMNVVGQNGNDGLHYETSISAYPESNITVDYEIQTPEGQEND